jgi:hypothetical protein
MKRLIGMLFGITLVALASPVFAEEAGSITISAPSNGAMLASGSGDKLDFDVHLGPTGNHVHIYVDDQNPIVYRDVGNCPCSINLPVLGSGKHTVVIKEATVSHALTGVQASVAFTTK